VRFIARLVRVPDQFLLSRRGERATVVVTAVSKKEVVVVAAALLW